MAGKWRKHSWFVGLAGVAAACALGGLTLGSLSAEGRPLLLAARPPDGSRSRNREDTRALPAGWKSSLRLSRARLRRGRLRQTTPAGEVVFTLDPQLQKRLESLLEKKQVAYGAAVVIDVATGRVVALAGRSKREPKREPASWALEPWAPAASVFKVVTAAALLEERRAYPATTVCYHGGFRRLTARGIRDSRLDRTCRSLSSAMAHSTNAIFAKLARRHLGPSTLAAYGEKLGFNRTIPFALPRRPSKLEVPKGDPIELARTAAGFWHSHLTALDAANLMATIARGGVERPPYVVDHVVLADGRKQEPERARARRVLRASSARALGRMLIGTTTQGTARSTFTRRGRPVLGVRVAGKTGSLTRRHPTVLDYSWFAGYAPARKPRYAVGAVVGNGPLWHIKAPYLARVALGEALSRSGKQADLDDDYAPSEGDDAVEPGAGQAGDERAWLAARGR